MKKVALITGGSSGLGYALAELLGKEGYSIVILARNQEKINKSVAALSAMNITAKGYSCDITDEGGLKKCFDQVKTEYKYNYFHAAKITAYILIMIRIKPLK